MIDLTDHTTLLTIKTALRRALNSLDNEISAIDINIAHSDNPQWIVKLTAKRGLLIKSRDQTRAIYDKITA